MRISWPFSMPSSAPTNTPIRSSPLRPAIRSSGAVASGLSTFGTASEAVRTLWKKALGLALGRTGFLPGLGATAGPGGAGVPR